MKNEETIIQLRLGKREKNKVSIMTLIQMLHCQAEQIIDSRRSKREDKF